jgi:acetyl-CoA synthetase
MTCSGADAGITADIAAAHGVPVPRLTPETGDALSRLLPDDATAQNPLDYTSLLWDEPAAIEALVAALGSDPGIGRVLALYDEPAGLDGAAGEAWTGVRQAIAAGAARSPVPVIVVATLPELLTDEAASALIGAGLPAVAGIRVGVRCARALATPVADPRRIAAIGAAAARRFRRADEWLAEHEVKTLLAEAGLPVAAGRLVADDDDAVAALSELGGPIALKLSARGLRHKAELGAVRLGLDDAARVRDEVASLQAMMSDGAGLLAERMAPTGVELFIAVRADVVVPVLVVGLGGVWTEALDDVAIAPLPVSPGRAERSLRSLRGAGVLLGERGRPEVDLAAAARLASGVGALLLDRGLALLELNPVIVHEAGATIVDALAVTGAGFEAAG